MDGIVILYIIIIIVNLFQKCQCSIAVIFNQQIQSSSIIISIIVIIKIHKNNSLFKQINNMYRAHTNKMFV